MISSNTVNYIELGYWKQTAKSKNRYYNLKEQDLQQIIGSQGVNSLSRFSIMVDYHYCSQVIFDYPDSSSQLGLVRLCSRSEDIDKAVALGEKIKNRTSSKLSMNFFNITNYSLSDLKRCVRLASDAGADYIYLADTHGSLDLEQDFDKYTQLASTIASYGVTPGFHLHDHSGKAYFNYRYLSKCGFGSTDFSLGGMGKGDGNLRLEHVVPVNESLEIFNHLEKYRHLLRMNPTSYGIISSHHSITDYYALQAEKHGLTPADFYRCALNIRGLDKDNFSKDALLP